MLILQQQCLQTGISAKRSRRRSWTSEYLFDCSLDCAALSRAPKRPRNTQDMKYTTIAPAPRKPKKSRYIPPEILLNVFSHLSQPELVSAGRACKQVGAPLGYLIYMSGVYLLDTGLIVVSNRQRPTLLARPQPLETQRLPVHPTPWPHPPNL